MLSIYRDFDSKDSQLYIFLTCDQKCPYWANGEVSRTTSTYSSYHRLQNSRQSTDSCRNVFNESQFQIFVLCTHLASHLSAQLSPSASFKRFTAAFSTEYNTANMWFNRNQIREEVWSLTDNPLERPTQLEPALQAPVARQASHH
jgi:hypothetical protein